MSLFFRAAPQPEARDVSLPWNYGGELVGSSTSAGVSVTTGSALRHGAVWSSVSLLASIVSNLPVDVFRGSGVNKVPVSPQPGIVASPSLIVSRREWVYQAMLSLLLRGNAYGMVMEWGPAQRPRAIEWLDPDQVTATQKSPLHRPTYEFAGEQVPDMIHMRAFVRPGTAIGMSPIEYHAEKIGVGLAAEKFGAQFYGGGGHPTALFQNTVKALDPGKASEIKERIRAVLRGKREPLVVGADWQYTPIQATPSEAAFLESQGYTDAQIAKLYGPGLAEILGYTESGSSLTYSNRVDRSLDVLTYAVLPWVGKFEDLLTGLVPQPQTVRFNVAALLRADPKVQREMFKIDREIGLHSIDEIRGLIDEPPLPDGQGEDYAPLKTAPAPNGGSNDG